MDGPLAFLSVAPSGKPIALGILHERHSPEMHRRLGEAIRLAGPGMTTFAPGSLLLSGCERVPVRSMIPDSFRASDVHDELVGVFDAGGGKRPMQVRIPDPATDQTFALSPKRLAVLAGEPVSFYAVPLPSGSRE